MEVLKEIIQKRSNSEIVGTMGLSVRTIENHRYNISRKTGTNTIQELKIWMEKHHLS
ncbi:MAG: Bacterial regulatory protein luxR family [Bacteroidetes bacterium]|jgi:DNA-binding CsgD family transcriptional regulator|nr:Bacterial regulatory protein luxR family [Bacteroidota bacterium]